MRHQYLLVALLCAIGLPVACFGQETAEAEAEVVAVEVGSAAPDFSLSWLGNTDYELSSLQGDDGKYAAVVFVRAYW